MTDFPHVQVEAVAKAMHDFWQGGGHSASRAWEITVEKLPGQARYFRELAGVALEAAAAQPPQGDIVYRDGDSVKNARISHDGKLFSKTAAAQPSEREAELVKATRELSNFAWSAVKADCTESAEYLSYKLETLRCALIPYAYDTPAAAAQPSEREKPAAYAPAKAEKS